MCVCVCVCVCSSYPPARTGCGEGGGGRHCVSLQLLSSDTRLIVHLNTAALSAARQPSPRSSPGPPACHAHHFSGRTAPNPPAAQTADRGSDKVCAALQTSFPNPIKLLTHPAWLAVSALALRCRCEAVCLQFTANAIRLFNGRSVDVASGVGDVEASARGLSGVMMLPLLGEPGHVCDC